jgi:hypothetical protein
MQVYYFQATLETCDICGDVLSGAFYKMEGKNVCEKDYQVGEMSSLLLFSIMVCEK